MFKLACFALVACAAATAPVISLDMDESMSLHKEKHPMASGMNQDWVERCDAKAPSKNCLFPKARAYDAHDKAVTVTTTAWIMDIENKPQGCDSLGKNCGKKCALADIRKCVDFNKRSTYVFKYDAQDEASNHAKQVVFVLVINDVKKPQLTTCGQPVEYAEGARPFDLCESRATDNVKVSYVRYTLKSTAGTTIFRGKMHAQAKDFIKSMIYNPKFLGKYVIYMWVTDHAGIYGVGGKSNTDSKTKGLVIRDTRKPWIVLSKNDRTTNNIECGSTYTDAGAILHDDFWPKPWNSKRALTSENSVNAKTCGIYTVRYNGKDVAKNVAPEKARQVHVHDTLAPKISLKGSKIEHHWSQDKFTDMGTVTSDQCDKALGAVKTWWSGASDNFNQKALGKHYLNYKICDRTNHCTTIKRTIVVADNKQPKLNLVGDSTVYSVASTSQKYNDRGAKCIDFVDGVLHHAIKTTISYKGKPTSSVDRSRVGKYSITYNCKDASGNNAAKEVRTVIVQDKQCPIMGLTGKGLIHLEAGVSTYKEAGFTAVDDIDGNIASDVKTSVTLNGKATGKVNTGTPGTYVLEYTVKDKSNNAQCKKIFRKVIVQDTLPPVIKIEILKGKGKQLSASGQKGHDGQTNKAETLH